MIMNVGYRCVLSDEAEHMDPQVRLLLEVTQEAFEDAGMPARSTKGSNTGSITVQHSTMCLTL